ncbi:MULTISPECIES: iron-siderophore ABC transporter substrate-binding protein [Micrococcaceae]|uniref:Iron ABC transporter, substrate binding protein n=1 Tax=Paenarthrobacter aurescens (strain TC1) TaxID=290340 RepID=A1RB34_PAEAT|nr:MULTISPECIES: iron-siderophore ABC transporter substrate-binding protein [Micrococcaceae]ABM10163.1 putative iron ABC transporter, substrate binding protein [Paenarthrobacter aurescens TC1]AFR30771.1 Fe3+-siderophore binding protein, FepB family [Arthrobacter sp. Rue61a]MBP2268688.1 iron complex transport system substrate-binding protein [Pseudarthrobacter sp. PvP004]
MASLLPRRALLKTAGTATAALAAVALSLTGCSTGPSTSAPASSEAASAAFPVTIKNVFGETTIKEQPKRVVTVSWVNDDVAIALGVVPVGVPKNEWGNNDKGSTPWKDAALEKLGAGFGTDKAPVQFSEADGINFTEIAKLSPDVILAAYSGLEEADYKKLSEIAPVVAQPELAFGTPWQESTTIIGKALGKEAEAKKLIEDTEATIQDKVSKYPQIKDKTFIYGNLDPVTPASTGFYTAIDNRPRFLSEIGMKLAPVVTQNTKTSTDFFIPWSAEKANELDSDVFITWVADTATADTIKADPLFSQIPAVKKGSFIADTNSSLTLSLSASSPLSLPWALDTFLPQLGAAADAAGK